MTETMSIQNKFIGPLRPVEIAEKMADYKEKMQYDRCDYRKTVEMETQIRKVRKKYTTYYAMLKVLNCLHLKQHKDIQYDHLNEIYGFPILGT